MSLVGREVSQRPALAHSS